MHVDSAHPCLAPFAVGILFDIGANHGAYVHTLHKLAPNARIFAFEPHPVTFAFLQARMAGKSTVRTVNMAVAKTSGRLKLYDFQAEDGSTLASLSESAVALYASAIVEHTCECTTVDESMISAGLDHIDLLKIDTEGHDLSVRKERPQRCVTARSR